MTKGFTLLETVMALAILGIASGSLITIFSESLYRIRHSEQVIHGSALAQSLLARVEAGELLLSGSSSAGAAEGGFFWTIQTQPYGSDQDRSAWIMQPRTIVVRVSWDNRSEKDTVALTTLSLFPKSAE